MKQIRAAFTNLRYGYRMNRLILIPIGLILLAALACTFPGLSAPTVPATPTAITPPALAVDAIPAEPTVTAAPTLPLTPEAYSLPGSSDYREEYTSGGDVTVIEATTIQHYTIIAPDADGVAMVMAAEGPADSVGNRWWALTEPLFDWRYECQCSDAGCITGPVTVIVSTTIQLPEWEVGAPTPDAQWSYFYTALRGHEEGHQALAGECGMALGRAMISIPPQTTCEALPAAITAATNPVFADCRAAQITYETETNHGINEGVVWPP